MKKVIAAAALALSAVAAAGIAAPAFAALQNGASAPEFTAKGMLNGEAFNFKLSDALKKGPVVVYFFPAAYTEGCTVDSYRRDDQGAPRRQHHGRCRSEHPAPCRIFETALRRQVSDWRHQHRNDPGI